MTDLVLTIDTGTTNTRVRAWRGDMLVAHGDAAAGVRDTARTGSLDRLREGVRDAVRDALAAAGAAPSDVRLALASGMITSGLGLLEVPHIPTPAGRPELARAMREARFDDLLAAPVWFVPGVRNDALPVTPDRAGAMDMMRGEETEVMGLLDRMGEAHGALTLLMPGSHAKFVTVDARGAITSCVSTLSGELLDLLVHQSVLASGMPGEWPDTIDADTLRAGADLSRTAGLGRAAFSTRVLEVYGGTSPYQRYAFLLGAVLMQDLLTMQATVRPTDTLVILGRPAIQHAYAILARQSRWPGEPVTPSAATLADLAGLGARRIARERGLL